MTIATFPAPARAGVPDEGFGARALRVVTVVALHGGFIAWLAGSAPPPAPTRPEPIRMEVRTIVAPARPAPAAHVPPPVGAEPPPVRPEPPPPARAEPPKPVASPASPKAPVARPAREAVRSLAEPVPATAPQAAVESSATAAAVGTAPATPPATPPASSPPVAAAAPVAIVAARFDADYLDNPAPVYPLMSRRRGEHGSVMVRVQVGADGAAQHVEVSQSCGYPRLDEAALKAVRAWRFVPARQGNEAVSASVIVPIVFALDR